MIRFTFLLALAALHCPEGLPVNSGPVQPGKSYCEKVKEGCDKDGGIYIAGDEIKTCECLECQEDSDCKPPKGTTCSGPDAPANKNQCYTPEKDCVPPSEIYTPPGGLTQCARPCTELEQEKCDVPDKKVRLACVNGYCAHNPEDCFNSPLFQERCRFC